MPQSVARAAAEKPTIRVLASASCIRSFARRASYQAKVKPFSGKAAWIESLNEKSGISTIGR